MTKLFNEASFTYAFLTRRTTRFALVLVFSVLMGNGSFAREKIPPNHVILLKAATECGAEETYSAAANRYSDRELEWLRTVLHFALNVEPIIFPDKTGFSFASDTGRKVSQREILGLVENPDFSKWAGEIVKYIRAVSAALFLVEKHRASLQPGKHSSNYLNAAKPIVQRYWDAYIDLVRKMDSKFGVISTDTGADCN